MRRVCLIPVQIVPDRIKVSSHKNSYRRSAMRRECVDTLQIAPDRIKLSSHKTSTGEAQCGEYV